MRELHIELVDLYVVAELRGVSQRERGGVAPFQISAGDPVLRGDDVGAGLIEYPVNPWPAHPPVTSAARLTTFA